jgi:transposase
VVCAGRTDTFLGARYRRLVTPTRQEEGHRRGRPITAGDHLASARPPHTGFHDLGSDFYDRHVNTTAKRRNHIRQLEALGYKVTLEPAA